MIPFFGLQKMQKNSGFTLIEFVVIISIFAIMAGVGLFNFRGFQTDVSLTNLAHDIALTIKRAQSEGTSGISNPGNPLGDGIPRGIAFSYDGNGVFSNEFTIFDDIDSDGAFLQNSGEVIDTIRIQSEDHIETIGTGSDLQNLVVANTSGEFLLIFQRPFPEVLTLGFTGNNDRYAAIIVSNQDGTKHQAVIVSRIGEISVRPCSSVINLCP